jgi:UDP-glucose 4-epimerase
MRVLVTGGAGYVGSHVAWALAESGHAVTVFDDLSEGHRAAAGKLPLIQGDILSAEDLGRAFRKTGAEAVVHMAAKCLVEESVRQPALYWRTNVVGGLRVLAAMQRAGAGLMVFSSSAAVYGQPDRELIDERAPREPCNPYGRTKLVFEQALADHQGQRPWTAPGAKVSPDHQQPATSNQQLRYVALRYFNAAGAHASGQIGEDHPVETHLVPNLLKAALSGGAEPLKIFGTDYPTPDGTAVRDYVHVEDLARAHVLALEYLAGGGESLAANLGTGRGSSIREVLAAARQVTGRDFPAEEAPRRAGDPARLVASNALAREKLGWEPRRSLQDVIASAWKWHSEHPAGFADRAAPRSKKK